MIKVPNILTLALVMVFAAPGALGGSIELRSSARIDALSPIVLGDIAVLEGADALALAQTVIFDDAAQAAKGKLWVEITTSDVRRALVAVKANVGRLSMSGATCTARLIIAHVEPSPEASPRVAAPSPVNAEDLKPSTIRASVAASIGRLLGVEKTNLRLLFERGDEDFLNQTTWGRRVTVQPTTASSSSNVMVDVRVFSAGDASLLERHRLRVLAQVQRRVVVMQRTLRRRETVKAGDVLISELWMDVDGSGPIGSLDEALGSIAKRRINAGRVLRTNDLEPPILVRRGQMVTVHCLRNGFAVKSRARAMAAGRFGEMVEFKLDGSSRSFTARVDGPGEAIIDLDHTRRKLPQESE